VRARKLRALLAVLGWALLELLPRSSYARELHWRELDVQARLAADGSLHVSETHALVFSGDWNGGERTFRVEDDQDLLLGSLSRRRSDGTWVPLQAGTLRNVDEYAWPYSDTLRWRSRPPTSPEYNQTEIDYRIDYELFDILVPRGQREFTLNHDFAFSDRPGTIEKFHLELSLDPAWDAPQPSPIEFSHGEIPPEHSFVVTLPLHFQGAKPPQPSSWFARWLRHLSLRWWRLGLCLAFFAACALLWRRLLVYTRGRGFFEPLTPPADIDAGWLREYVLAHPAEVIGALYHGEVGPPEVAGLLARLQLEGKLVSSLNAEHADLALELRVPRSEFKDYERTLIDRLFFDGDHSSTGAIQEHYAKLGFEPAQAIARGLLQKVELVRSDGARPRRSHASWIVRVLLVLGANAVLVELLLRESTWNRVAAHVLSTGAAFSFTVVGVALAVFFANCVTDLARPLRRLAAWLWISAGLYAGLVLLLPASGITPLLCSFVFAFLDVEFVFFLAKPNATPRAIALRKHAVAARNYFAAELDRPAPALEDAWFPHLIALGLARNIDAWFRVSKPEPAQPSRQKTDSFGSESANSSSVSAQSSEDRSTPSWTGGGGMFGGGGASGSWANATSSLAQGVAAPVTTSSGSWSSTSSSTSSSSDSVSSSTSSGSSSGGGGGGGW
jgi:uncharacterized membrane protein YgcG